MGLFDRIGSAFGGAKDWVASGVGKVASVARDPNVLKFNPLTGPLYWTGAGLNAGLNALSGRKQGTINPIVKNASLYDAGPVLGDGRGGLQAPFFNRYAQDAVKETIRIPKNVAKNALNTVSEGLFGVPFWVILVAAGALLYLILQSPQGKAALRLV